MPHSDECTQRIMEAVEADDEGRMKMFLDKNAPRRPAPEIFWRRRYGTGCCGTSSCDTNRSTSEAIWRCSEQQLRRGSERSVPASAGTPEQRQATRVRFESPAEHSQDGRTRLSAKRASEKDAEGLEPENLERPSSSSGVVIPSDMPLGGTRDVEDVNASPGEIGRQDVSNFQLSRVLQFGDEKANLVELASIRVRDALWYRDCDIGKNELQSVAMHVELGAVQIWETLGRSSPTNKIPIRPGFILRYKVQTKL